MKTIYRIAVVISLAVATVSCVDFLTEDPKTQLSENVVYNTEADLEKNLIGCYALMRVNTLWQGNLFEALGYASGLLHWKGDRSGNNLYVQGLNLTYFSNQSENYSSYQALYRVIYSCNKLIENLPNSPVDGAYKAEIDGETRLLRAICYFTAVRMWGDVSLSVTTPKSAEEANLPRTSYILIYKQILEDLSAAERTMRDAKRQEEVTGLTGRPNKWAATAFKAAVYTQIGSILSSPNDQPFREAPDFTVCGITDAAHAWKLALETAEKVIKEGPYELAPKYTDLFRWTDPSDYLLKERIFVLQITENGSTTGCYTATRSLPNYIAGCPGQSVSNSNQGRIRPSRYFFQRFARTYGGVPETGRSDNLTNVCVSCPDPRFDATFIYSSYQRYSTSSGNVSKYSIYPSSGKVTNVNKTNAQNDTAEPYLKKYFDPKYNASRGYADLYMMRFAEMYLIAAEAAAELSTGVGDEMWTKAYDYIEVLHARARRTVTPEASQPRWESDQFTTKKDLIAGIVYERFFEMYGEGHEFFDLRRRGAQFMIDNFSIPMNAFLKEPEQNYETNGEFDCFASVLYMDKSKPYEYPTTVAGMLPSLLCAFPAAEIRVNQAIGYEDQNPYIIQ